MKRPKKVDGPDKNYGNVSELGCAILDMSPDEYLTKKQIFLNTLKIAVEEIKEVEKKLYDNKIMMNGIIIENYVSQLPILVKYASLELLLPVHTGLLYIQVYYMIFYKEILLFCIIKII